MSLNNADPLSEQIIRCKNCKYSEFWYRDKRLCFLWHEEGIDVFDDGFCNYAKMRTDDDMQSHFKAGQYVVYVNGDSYELGRIKTLHSDGAFIAYHEGETGAKTPYDRIHPIINAYTIKATSLGGDYFNEKGGEAS